MNAADDERVTVPSHTPKPLPTYLRAELTSSLLSNSTIPVIQSTLYNASQEAGWTEAVLERAKQLFNSGQGMSAQEVLDVIVKESHPNSQGRKGIAGGMRRGGLDRGVESKDVGGEVVGVRFPERAIVEGKEVIKQALEDIVEVEGVGAVR